MSADHREQLRRLVLYDNHLIRSMLETSPGEVDGCGLDPKSSALVRLAALVVQDAGFVAYHWGVEWALAAGATADEIVGTLLAVAPITGITRVVAAAPDFAQALGYDLDSALESWDEDPA